MQTTLHRFKVFLGFALALALGPLSLGAHSAEYHLAPLTMALREAGQHGADAAKFTAEQAHMAARTETASTSTAGLVRDSHGFLQLSADGWDSTYDIHLMC